MNEPTAVTPGHLVGQTLGHYRIKRLLGRGGMGEVYQAFDTRLRRDVALKCLSVIEAHNAETERRLLREARAASAVDHPGVVRIHEVGTSAGRAFIVMEWVRGQVLAEHLRLMGPLPADEALTIGLQIAEAMQAAHASGVVHRDLKPRNLILTPEGRVRVLDFGIAKPDPLSAVETFDTVAGTTARPNADSGPEPGTLPYMSPEQLLGEHVDARTDIFSLGIVLYEMLAGVHPFEGAAPNEITPIRRLHNLLYERPPHLSLHVKGLPLGIDRVVDTMLATAPDDRYPTMAAVADALQAIASSATRPPPDTETSTRPSRISWRSIAAALAITIAIAIAAGTVIVRRSVPGTTGGATPIAHSRAAVAVCPAEERGVEPSAFDRWRTGERLLARFDRDGNVERAIACFEDALSLQPEHAASHSGLSRAYRQQHQRYEDDAWRVKSLSSARHAVALDPHLTHAQVSLALAWIDSGQGQDAERILESLLTLDPSDPSVHTALAELAVHRGNADVAIRHRQQAVAQDPDAWNLWGWLGDSLYQAGRLEEAEEAYRTSLRHNPDHASAHRNLAAIHHHRGDLIAATEALQHSLLIQPTGSGYSNLGTVYFFRGFYQEAAAAFEAALEIDANDYQIWANLGDAYRQLEGHDDAARSAYRTAVRLLRGQAHGPSQPETQSRLALYLARAGDLREARPLVASVAERAATDAPNVWFRTALVFEMLDERDAALDALAHAVAAGYPTHVLDADPELLALRQDVRYHRLIDKAASPDDR